MYTSVCVAILLGIASYNYVLGQPCRDGWNDYTYSHSCYKFIRAPTRDWTGAKEMCRTYNAELVSVNNLEEHVFIMKWLRQQDPQHRSWFTSGRDDGDNYWVWEGDGTQFSNIESLWLNTVEYNYHKNVAYNYSVLENRWGLLKVSSSEPMAFICEISKENLHSIVILERNIDYGIIVEDRERLPRGPKFIEEPKSEIFDISGRYQLNDISLRCVADGWPAPIYKWYKEEYQGDRLFNYEINPLSDGRFTQTDGTLTINNPQQDTHRGKYHCTASNKFGTALSQTVQLTFGFLGEFNKKRSLDVGNEYWGKSLSCDAPQHYPKANFFWTRDKFPNFVQEDRRVMVSQDGNLYFSSLEKIDNAIYSCNLQSVISPTGRTGPFFQLKVEPTSSGQKLLFPNNFPKIFPEAPLAGVEVRLECIAYGYPVPVYNWTRRGYSTNLPEGSYIINYDRILILPNVTIEDVGEYVCTATNGIETIHRAVSLSIQAWPVFTIELGNKVVDRGTKVIWTCEAFGIPDVKYTWLKNGKEILQDGFERENRLRYRVMDNVFTIEDAQSERDDGMYQCRATNQIGDVYSTGQLKVITLKPSFEKYPLESETYAAIGSNVTVACLPEAAPFPDFTWKRNDVVIPVGGRVRIQPNGYLFIEPVQREDEGTYTCVARNEYGSAESKGKLIVLHGPRMIEYPPSAVSVLVNETFELRCAAIINENVDLAYIWRHNGLVIDFELMPQFDLGRYNGDLRIHNVSLAEAGEYNCIAKSPIGNAIIHTNLFITGPPGSTGAVLAEGLTSRDGTIQWSDGSDNGRPVHSYTIQGRTNHNSTWKTLTENATYWSIMPDTSRRQVKLQHVLSPWSTYVFRVAAINSIGRGPFSEPSPQYNTLEDRPYMAPQRVGGGGGKTGSLTISWDPLPPQDWNSPDIWYRVYYKLNSSGPREEFNVKELKDFGNIGLFSANVGEHNYYLPYVVKVQAINSVGEGPESPLEVVYSAEGMPTVQPSQVRAIQFNSTALRVSWNPMDLSREKIRGKLIGYRIKYWRVGDNPEQDSLTILKRGLETVGLIVGLQPYTRYSIVVMAYNEAGSGPESEYFIAETYKSAPLRPPTSVYVKALSPTSVLVTWRGVVTSIQEESILGYKVRYWEADQSVSSAIDVLKYLDGGDLEAVVSGLTPGKNYKLRVLAFSKGGDGKMSSPSWDFKVWGGVVSSYTSSVSRLLTSSYLVVLFCIVSTVRLWR